MRTMIFTALMIALPAFLLAQPAAAQIQVAEAVLATDIEDRQPQGVAEWFPNDVEQVYLWTRVTGVEGESVTEHVWYFQDEEVDRVSLRIGSPNWRTWSAKSIPSDWTGSWRVDVLGPDDEVLESMNFTIE